MGLLTECFFVEVIRVPVYLPRRRQARRRSTRSIGTHANVEMAAHVHAFLLATADRLWHENRGDARVNSGRDRLRYQSGVIRGFRDKLRRRAHASSRAPASCGSAMRSLDRSFARVTRGSRRRRRVRMTGAHAAGREAGRTVVLHKPVTKGLAARRSPAVARLVAQQ